MTPLTWGLIIPAGALGALARYETGRVMWMRFGLRAPWGVLAVNLVGAFLLGLLAGAHPSDVLVIALGTGFLGSFTTFSGLQLEAFVMMCHGRSGAAVFYVLASVVVGLLAALVGRRAVQMVHA